MKLELVSIHRTAYIQVSDWNKSDQAWWPDTIEYDDLAPDKKSKLYEFSTYVKQHNYWKTKRPKRPPFDILPDRLVDKLSKWKPALVSDEDIIQRIGQHRWDGLKDFQQDGVRFMLERHGKILLADEMGTGKSRQSLIGACYFNQWPCLITCPAVGKTSWPTEIANAIGADTSVVCIATGQELLERLDPIGHKKEWTSAISKAFQSHLHNQGQVAHRPVVQSITTCIHEYLTLPVAQFHVVSYGLLTDEYMTECLKNIGFRTIIADESQLLQNVDAGRTQSLRTLTRPAPRVFVLSGTPMTRPKDLYSQLCMLHEDLFDGMFIPSPPVGSYYFAWRYCEPKKEMVRKGVFKWSYKGATRMSELHAICDILCMLRRRKEAVIQGLPKKIRQRFDFSLDSQETEKIREIMKEIQELRKTNLKLAEAKYMELYHLTPEYKIPHIQALLKNMLTRGWFAQDPSLKMLVFAYHTSMLDAVQEIAEECKVEYVRIDGSTSQKNRKSAVDRFQQDDGPRIAILNEIAAGTSITLTRAVVSWFIEPYFVPGVLLQAEDRNHRMTQTKDVHIQYFIAKGTLDESMWRSLQRKIHNASLVIDGKSIPFHAIHEELL
jgi:SWI/SNF-related matrix-associated actin-dependent regulator of chromatin subfamily A-like protein 1